MKEIYKNSTVTITNAKSRTVREEFLHIDDIISNVQKQKTCIFREKFERHQNKIKKNVSKNNKFKIIKTIKKKKKLNY
jgi:hypothetical protein